MIMTAEDLKPHYEKARHLTITEKQPPDEVMKVLKADGLDEVSASKMISLIQQNKQVNGAVNSMPYDDSDEDSGATKDILVGGLFFFGGLIATIADFGYIFYGAIIFGGIQFFRGLYQHFNN